MEQTLNSGKATNRSGPSRLFPIFPSRKSLFYTLEQCRKIPPMKSMLLLLVIVAVTCGSTSSQERMQYFPANIFYDSPVLDAGVIKWYSKYLSVLGEPSLWAESKDSKRELYRFLWVRTWDQPISVRVVRNDDGSATLTLKVATGSSGGDRPGKLSVVRTKKLNKDEFDAVADKFAASGFWTMAPTVPSNGNGRRLRPSHFFFALSAARRSFRSASSENGF